MCLERDGSLRVSFEFGEEKDRAHTSRFCLAPRCSSSSIYQRYSIPAKPIPTHTYVTMNLHKWGKQWSQLLVRYTVSECGKKKEGTPKTEENKTKRKIKLTKATVLPH